MHNVMTMKKNVNSMPVKDCQLLVESESRVQDVTKVSMFNITKCQSVSTEQCLELCDEVLPSNVVDLLERRE